jgi:hypothetical protein
VACLKGHLVELRRPRRAACIPSGLVSVGFGAYSATLTSPTARNLPSGLKDTQVAAFILSRDDQALLAGESFHSLAGEASGEPARPLSRREAAVRFLLSFCVGVEAPP